MIVSSFSEKGYATYGKAFIEGFLEHWKDETLVIYFESPIDIEHPRLIKRDMMEIPDMDELLRSMYESDEIFKGLRPTGKKSSDDKPELAYDYRFDAYRFCRKVMAVTHAAAVRENDERIAWLDADVVFHETIPEGFLKTLIPDTTMLSYLGRPWAYTETGFVGFNPAYEGFDAFMGQYRSMYTTGAFRWLGHWHDCYVFDMVRMLFGAEGYDLAKGMNVEHPFISSQLGEYMDHLKGPERKQVGRSHQHEHIGVKKTAHWLNAGEQVQGITDKDEQENVA